MRFGTRALITAAFAGPAIAAMILSGAGPANAAVTTPTTHSASTWVPPQFCNPYHLERWDFRGNNTVDLWFNSTEYTYAVHFDQRGGCLSGTLTDTGLPAGEQYLHISGAVVRNQVTFSVNYPTDFQGTRTFHGYVDQWGHVSGNWSETGSEAGSGTWSLANAVRPACPQWGFWYGFGQYGAGCPVPFPYWWYY